MQVNPSVSVSVGKRLKIKLVDLSYIYAFVICYELYLTGYSLLKTYQSCAFCCYNLEISLPISLINNTRALTF